MTIVCAWCKKVMNWGRPFHPISHGICQKCAGKVEEEIKRMGGKNEKAE